MSAAVLLGVYEQHEHWTVMIKRPLKPYDDTLNFLDHVLMAYIDCQDNQFWIWSTCSVWLWRPTRRRGALPVVVKITNALGFRSWGWLPDGGDESESLISRFFHLRQPPGTSESKTQTVWVQSKHWYTTGWINSTVRSGWIGHSHEFRNNFCNRKTFFLAETWVKISQAVRILSCNEATGQ